MRKQYFWQKWTIRTKLLTLFGGISVLLIVQMCVTHNMALSTTAKVEAGLQTGYKGSLLAESMRFNVSQVWQYLQDVSATRENDSFKDAEQSAQDFLKDAKNLQQLQPANSAQVQQTVGAFNAMYAVGKDMAGIYVKEGTKAGNRKMVAFDKSCDELITHVAALEQKITQDGQKLLEDSILQSRTSDRISTILAIMVIALILIVSLIASNILAKRLKRLVTSAQRVAIGDVNEEIRIDDGDEIGRLAEAFHSVVIYQREMATVAQSVADGDLLQTIQPKSDEDAFGTAFSKMITHLRLFMGSIAENAHNLGSSCASLSVSATNNTQAADSVTESCEAVKEASAQSSRTSSEIAHASEQQATAATEASWAMERLHKAIGDVQRVSQSQQASAHDVKETMRLASAAVAEVISAAERMATMTAEAARKSEESGQAVQLATESMQRIQAQQAISSGKVQQLGNKSAAIGAIVETIDQISEQTNLLALNAAIEAARAGEHGKGFAVVADEVRKLAEHAASATREIGSLVASIRSEVAEVVDAIEISNKEGQQGAARSTEAGHALVEILSAVQAVAEQAQEVTGIADRLSGASQTVTSAVSNMEEAIEESHGAVTTMVTEADKVGGSITSVAATSEETAAGAQEMSATAAEVAQAIERVTESVSEQRAAMSEIDTSARSLHEMATHFLELVELFQWDRRHKESDADKIMFADRRKISVDQAARRILLNKTNADSTGEPKRSKAA